MTQSKATKLSQANTLLHILRDEPCYPIGITEMHRDINDMRCKLEPVLTVQFLNGNRTTIIDADVLEILH